MQELGSSGIVISDMAWGMWRFAGSHAESPQARIECALEVGFTLFDTADIYGRGAAEELFGEVMAASPALRDRIVIATKGGIIPKVAYDSSASYLEAALEASLRRLRVETIDLYQIHRRDLLTHPADLARTLERMVKSGKVRAVGVSNHAPAEVAALRNFLDVGLVSTQPEMSLGRLQAFDDGTLDDAMSSGMSVLAWSPLGGGMMFDANDALDRLAGQLAEQACVSREAIALSWLMHHPSRVVPIVGTQNCGRMRAAAMARQVQWCRDDWYQVLTAARGFPLP